MKPHKRKGEAMQVNFLRLQGVHGNEVFVDTLAIDALLDGGETTDEKSGKPVRLTTILLNSGKVVDVRAHVVMLASQLGERV